MRQNVFLLILSLLGLINCVSKPKTLYNAPIPDHESFAVTSNILNESRVINVWLPPDYRENGDAYPVMYMPDGGIIMEDFPHVANTIAKLIEEKRIPPIILVGIKNTDRRRDLTGYSDEAFDAQYAPQTDGAKNFRSFIKEELMPEIGNKYRVTEKKGIIGESFAGLFVVETLMLEPELFDYYIGIDPSLWWDQGRLVEEARNNFESFPDNDIRFWFAGSDAEDIYKYTRQLKTLLDEIAPSTLKWQYSDEPGEQHSTIFLATKERALEWVFNP